ncbi:Aspartic peptidase, DDI1-type [Corchorus capsularis]|uniref:Aspartic peptidase, DDI1-type n=1 Tax=Corchorus capsularis TaxID=210143 RepID=A0A1R3HEC0_COCAP|nr:Aspartic peptidase, DDI1-type [Corchorus capsularis]
MSNESSNDADERMNAQRLEELEAALKRKVEKHNDYNESSSKRKSLLSSNGGNSSFNGGRPAKTASRQQISDVHKAEEETEGELARVGSLRFLNALYSQLNQLMKGPSRGLLYVDMVLNGKATKVIVDTSASDTFITPEEAKRCGLTVDNDCGQMKAVNSPASTICGSAKRVMTKLGHWEGDVDLTVSPMDDFDVILGLDFMKVLKRRKEQKCYFCYFLELF